EDAIVLSLGETHSFALEEVARYLNGRTVREVLVQALLAAPLFTTRWRWNASVALAVKRYRGGKKNPAPLQRIEAEDLMAVVFPDQLACAENLTGAREVPDHPLVNQTVDDCLHQAMDLDGLTALLEALERGEKRIMVRDLPHPSPLAQEILNARPYAFLDDAPLEERRTQAVLSRRWLDPQTAADVGRLDPAAIAQVRAEAWPEVQNADELHDALMLLGFVTETEGTANRWESHLDALIDARRAARLCEVGGAQVPVAWVAAEALPMLRAALPDRVPEPAIAAPAEYAAHTWTPEQALVEIVRGRLQGLGPVTPAVLAQSLGVTVRVIERALSALETEGFALRGRFTPEAADTEWCERRLLARIHRYTLKTLRAEIEPVSAADFLRFLLQWHGLTADPRPEGPQALAAIVEQLEGFEAAAAAWEADVLPARMRNYDPQWLDGLCLSGRVAWARLTPPKAAAGKDRSAGPVRTTPVALLTRRNLSAWRALADGRHKDAPRLTPRAQAVADYLRDHGASFFDEIVSGTGLLRTQTEQALGELVAGGRVNCDGYTGLRALLLPSDRRRGYAGYRRRGSALFGIEDAGRWTLLRGAAPAGNAAPEVGEETIERLARVLLRRYGVVFRRLLEREVPWLPPWYQLLRVYRRLEARGEIRGGRFVAGFSGEQYALPEAVGALRELRRRAGQGTLVSVSAADPLNLAGVLTPGARVPALAGNRVLYRDGVPIAVHVGGEARFLVQLDAGAEWEARNALLRQPVTPALRAYLN
ncbi:MAG: ATP-dependent DNA helicase, partial [Gammaproteobacteria bacterium]|nr:ATP-dependent DNA helicase [Gammaproteobacteria bacterium]